MAYLFLDTRFRGQAGAWWIAGEHEEPWVEQQETQDVLRTIQEHRERLAGELRGVAVLAGPGRFSAVRVGILYAHVLARWYRVPLYRLQVDDIVSVETRKQAAQDIVQGLRSVEVWIDPLYDRAPNITQPSV